ncbi:MAG: hypothetical protein Q4F23_00640 [Coriobacteriia bacterium]|nr:hypothetical protein [Coriobacteriia bacterium]
MPTKRTDNGRGKRTQRPAARPSASRGGTGRGTQGYTSPGKRSGKNYTSPRMKNPTQASRSTTRNRNQAPGSRRGSVQSPTPSIPQIVGGVVGSIGAGISSVVNSFSHKDQGGFSTSFAGTQKGTLPTFSSQQAQTSGPGNVGLEGGAPNQGPEMLLTRRNVVVGAAALGGVALVGGGISMAIDHFEGSSDTVNYISVAEEAITGVDDLKQVKQSTYVETKGKHHLPFGTLVFADNDSYACLLVPGETSSPLNTVRCMSLSSGNTTKLLSKAKGTKDGFEIVDARLSEKGLVWVESNPYESSWRVYAASFSEGKLDKALRLDEGDANWLIPSIAATQSRAFWQLCPNTEGDEAASPSVVRSATFGSKDHTDLVSSKRAFATRLSPVDEGVVCTPRAEATGTYYQLTLLDGNSGEVTDTMVLPSNMHPDQASYGRTGFSFGFTDTYNYGGGIAKLGTYTPMQKTQPHEYDNLSSWLRYGRTPSAEPCWCGEWFCVKSTRSIAGIHFAKKRYFSIDLPSDTDDWGEYLASSGICTKLVGVSNITPSDGSDPYTLVRIFTTKSGKLGSAL